MHPASTALPAALLLSLLVAPASAQDPLSATERRIEASLTLPARLGPAPYLEIVRRERRRKAYERYGDPTLESLGETGLHRLHAPVKVDIVAFVLDQQGHPYALFLDNFAAPLYSRSTIPAGEVLRSLGFR